MVIDILLISVLLAAFISQSIKISIFFFRHKLKINWSDVVATGGFPSTHTALVTSLMASIFLEQRFSALFAVSFVIFTIVLTDSLGVRRTVGEEADALNKFAKKSKIKIFHTSHGHTPKEVLAGIIIGAIISVLVFYLI